MKTKLLYAFLIFTGQTVFSQSEKIINGKVLFQNYPVPNVEVINSKSKKATISDAEGNFSINVKLKDTIVFISKKYELKKVSIKPLTFQKGYIYILLNLKPEELEEVTIIDEASIK